MELPGNNWFEEQKAEAEKVGNEFFKYLQAKGFNFIFLAKHPFGIELSAHRGSPIDRLGFSETCSIVARAEIVDDLHSKKP